MIRLATLLALPLLATPGPAQAAQDVIPGAPTRKVLRFPTLKLSDVPIDFGATRVGESAGIDLPLINVSDVPVEVSSVTLTGADAAAFGLTFGVAVPFTLAPGASELLSFSFDPASMGGHDATLTLDHDGPTNDPATFELRGLGLGPVGSELFMNAAGTDFVGSSATWVEGWGDEFGEYKSSFAPVAGTVDDALYQTLHSGPFFEYELALPSGWYEVDLHFNEPVFALPGRRLFDVVAEGELVLDDLDVYVEAGRNVAHVETFKLAVTDGGLSLDFVPVEDEPVVCAIAIRGVPQLEVAPQTLTFSTLEEGQMETLDLTLTNVGAAPLTITSLSILPELPAKADALSVDFDGLNYVGLVDQDVTYPVNSELLVGDSLVVPVTFHPILHDVYSAQISFGGNFDLQTGLVFGIASSPGHPFLHVVIDSETQAVDYDGDGEASILFDGTLSHTHELGHVLTDFTWTEGANVLSTAPLVTPSLTVGPHQITLEIGDDNIPQETLAGSVDVEVFPITNIPGVLVRYYDGSGSTAGALLDAVPPGADFGEVLSSYRVENSGGQAGGSAFASNVMVQLQGRVTIASAGNYEFLATGGSDRRVEVGGVPAVGPVALTPGQHDLEVRFAVDTLGDLPLEVQVSAGGAPAEPIDAGDIFHSEAGVVPVINSLPPEGTTLGGNQIEILGLGFFPPDQVTIHWGATDLFLADTSVLEADRIVFTSPPGTAGTISVTVETPAGTSNARDFSYESDGPVPITFQQVASIFVGDPTCGAWGPDGRFYVGRLNGKINAFSFNDDWTVASEEIFDGLIAQVNPTITGLAFDPREPTGKLYVSHGLLFFPTGGAIPPGTVVPYYGQVSTLDGPSYAFNAINSPLITGLPGTNHDHAVNGLEFNHDGELFVTVGSATNAGIPGVNSGDLPESPYSVAILKADVTRPDFDGAISYLNSSGVADGNADDQIYGWDHTAAPGPHLEVFAAGLRNPYDIELHTNGHLYATDNGPNLTFGPASLSATTQSIDDPDTNDELVLVEQGNYYGSPNRNRGRFDDRENVFHANGTASVGAAHTGSLVELAPSTNGLTEYRSENFGGQMRGDLIAQRFGSFARRIELADNGRSVTNDEQVGPFSGALDAVTGPGGALMLMSYNGDRLKIFEPVDLSLTNFQVLDIHPWRGSEAGGTYFVLGGHDFGTLANTTVQFGGVAATLTDVRPTRIEGFTPALTADGDFVDVTVTVGGVSDTLTDAFRPLGPRGSEPGFWEDARDLPNAVGEVVGAEVDDVLYVWGEGSNLTFAYDLLADTWTTTGAVRPFVGHHHSCEVVDGKIYLVGGLGGGSEGKIQVYDPVLDQWTVGTNDIPWGGGSVQTALIDGEIYVAGGIVGNTTVDNHAKYDPLTEIWTSLAPHPTGLGRNHAAAATDGEKFWIFGGRGVGSGACNCVANGFAQVQVYDPQTDTWETSDDVGSSLAPMPIGRGGMGKAIYFQGEFYVLGGETLNGPGAVAGNVYDRVDVYDPVNHTWRLDRPMPVPRHGIYPVLYLGRIYVAGGGTVAAFSQSLAADVLNHQ